MLSRFHRTPQCNGLGFWGPLQKKGRRPRRDPLYYRAKFHADRWHRRQDVLEHKERKTERYKELQQI